ncbi:MAG: hypothetical protein NT087_06720, partial [Deltaproteobacteria bacterium]|nr:hypothetical protein [Deltaproteobacteria bacterium]
ALPLGVHSHLGADVPHIKQNKVRDFGDPVDELVGGVQKRGGFARKAARNLLSFWIETYIMIKARQ